MNFHGYVNVFEGVVLCVLYMLLDNWHIEPRFYKYVHGL
jgi:hypothetical protein